MDRKPRFEMTTVLRKQTALDPGGAEPTDDHAPNRPITNDVSRSSKKLTDNEIPDVRLPGSIAIVRNRILYARAELNAKGRVRSGLRHIRESEAASYFLNHLTSE